MLRTALIPIACAVVLASACGPREDPRAAAFRERLKQESEIGREEMTTLFALVAPAIANKALTVRRGAVTLALDEKQRLEVLGVLSEPAAVYDAGVKVEGTRTLRGIRASGTPAMSEIDASQTIWIDVATFTPVRYDFEYSVPGFGDYSYDLMFN